MNSFVRVSRGGYLMIKNTLRIAPERVFFADELLIEMDASFHDRSINRD
jgi:hypothetical protein